MTPTTREQREALAELHKRQTTADEANGRPAISYKNFRRKFSIASPRDPYLGGVALGMFIGIEPNGYTHS